MKQLIAKMHYFFLPHPENNYKAKTLQLDFLSIYLMLAIIICFSYKTIGGVNVLGFASDITVEKLFQLTNQQRLKNNLPQLSYSEKLSTAALAKAKDMFKKDYWSHYAPDGTAPWDFILQADYQYEYAGENLAKNFLFSQGVIEAWMNSSSHRENILRPNYSEVGFAVVNGILNGEETTLVVQMFAKPTTYNFTKSTNIKNQTVTLHDETKNNVLAQKSPTYFPAKKLAYNFNLLFFGGLLIILAVDFLLAVKLKVISYHHHNLPHVLFVVFILLGLFFLKKGAII
jgi:hypothetical protein